MKDIAIYGAGGYGREVACLIKKINSVKPLWNLVGFFDDGIPKGDTVEYGIILGDFTDLNNWDKDLSLVVAIGNSNILKEVISKINNQNISYPNLIAPNVTFYDEETVKWGKGNIVFFNSIISCYTTFGDFNLLNNSVFLGHNSSIGSYNVINPSVRISGDVRIGDVNFFGVSSIILQGLTVGNNTKLSAGGCLFRNTNDGLLYAGNPAVIRLTPNKRK